METEQEGAFHGVRYLMEANGIREFALRFDNGLPKKPFRVFDAKGGGFRANETIFALDDDIEYVTSRQSVRLSTILYQIDTDGTGQPRHMKMCGCEYDVLFAAKGKTIEVTYRITPETAQVLAEKGFSISLPNQFTAQLDAGQAGVWRHSAGVQIDPQLIRSLPFPPQFENGAFVARLAMEGDSKPAVAGPKPKPILAAPPAPSPFTKIDDQTLVETKKLGNGEKLKVIFDFEARRVTEIFDAPSKTAMTGHSFDEHDREALDAAYDRLVELKGKPKPLDGTKKPSLKIDPK